MSGSDTDQSRVRLRAIAASEATRIRVADASFQSIALTENAGEVEVALPHGLYEVTFLDADAAEQHFVTLRPGTVSVVEVQQGAPARSDTPATISPLSGGIRSLRPGSRAHLFLDEPDPDVPGRLTAPADGLSEEEVLIIVHDTPLDGAEEETTAPPGSASTPESLTQGLSLVGAEAGRVIEGIALPVSGAGEAALRFRTGSGLWRLRLQTGLKQQVLEMPIVVCPGWRTMLHLPALAYGSAGNRRADLGRAQLRMTKPGPRPEAEDYRSRRLEANAIRALSEGRELRGQAFDGMLRNLLTAEYDYPMLGIYAGYLVARRVVANGQDKDISLLDDVVRHLDEVTRHGPDRTLSSPAGFHHPDVAALKLRVALAKGSSLDDIAAFDFPPMLLPGWQILLEAARQAPWLVPPGSLSDRVAARLQGPGLWVIWSGTEEWQRSADLALRDEQVSALRTLMARPTRSALSMSISVPVSSAAPSPMAEEPASPTEMACALIDTALHHAKLRDWLRAAFAPLAEAIAQDPATGTMSPLTPAVPRSVGERMLVQAVHPLAAYEKDQAELDASRHAARQRASSRWDLGRLEKELSLPPATIGRAALGLAADLLDQAERLGLDLKARTPMTRPELIIPYDPAFLGDGFDVPLPRLSESLRTAAYAGGEVLDYTHFSLVMHAPRRVAIYTAHNIDASRMVRISTSHPWRMDERAGEFQMGPETYDNNQLDKGHLVRRMDVLWGSVETARLANKATFFYTNAAPQHQNFNQDEWLALENWVLERATDFSYRLSVFTGPVLRQDDPVLDDLPPNLRVAFRARGQAQIPAAFWKVIVLRDATAGGEDLAAVCFAMRQSDMWTDKDGDRLLNLKVHQVTLEAIEGWTGLDFGALKEADELAWSEERLRQRDAGKEPPWPLIRDRSDLVFTGLFRRGRGHRAARTGAPRFASASRRAAMPRQGLGELRLAGDCGCGPKDSFDAREAIAALARDLALLTEAVAGQAQAAEATQAAGASPGGPRRLPEAGAGDAVPSTLPPEVEERAEAMVAAAPERLKERARVFAYRIAEQAEIARGRMTAPPAELTRIVGGDFVPTGGFPECCCIGDATDWFCTGVLVAPQVVLTAAHCGGDITRVMLKGNNVRELVGSEAIVIPVRQVVTHPRYAPHPRNENDINVLILARPAGVPPVAIASVDQIRDAEQVRLVGFGYNDPVQPKGFGRKRQVTVEMGFTRLSPEDNDLDSLAQHLGFHSNYEFTAGRKGLGRDSCNGDSGGPAYIMLADGTRVVAGLTSRATREAVVNCGDGGIYVRPDYFQNWILAVMRDAGLSPLP